MFELFTEKAIKVIMLAQEESRRTSNNYVGAEQILLGLIGEGTGVAAQALRASGVTLKEARRELEEMVGRGSDSLEVEIPFTPLAKKTLERSWQEARQRQDNYISTEHLLWGIIAEEDGAAIDLLARLKVNHQKLSSDIEYLKDETAPRTDGFTPWKIIGELFGKKEEKESVSEAVQQLLTLAVDEAGANGRNLVGTEHILLSLLRGENSSVAVMCLNDAGITLEKALAEAGRLHAEPTGKSIDPPMVTPLVTDVIRRATEEAKKLNQKEVKPEHVLLALLACESGAYQTILRNLGVDVQKLRAELVQMLQG